jgi:formate hydrogenlyase subunit 3/multisubunit Na+/H+ antiporter MnhD subunit
MVMENYFAAGILFFLFGAVMSCVVPGKAQNYSYVLSAIGAVNLIIAGLYLSAGAHISVPSIPISPTLEFSFQGDALSGFFVTVMSILTLSVSIYSIGYTKNIDNKGLMGFLYNLFYPEHVLCCSVRQYHHISHIMGDHVCCFLFSCYL